MLRFANQFVFWQRHQQLNLYITLLSTTYHKHAGRYKILNIYDDTGSVKHFLTVNTTGLFFAICTYNRAHTKESRKE